MIILHPIVKCSSEIISIKKVANTKTKILRIASKTTIKDALTFTLKVLVLKKVCVSIKGVQVDQQGLENILVVVL